MSGGNDQTQPTEQQVMDWFKDNFGLALYPNEPRKQWVRKHWAEVATEGPHEESKLPPSARHSESEAEEYVEDKLKKVRKLEAGRDKELLEKLCPDLVRYFDAAPRGVYVIAEPGPRESQVRRRPD